MKYDEFVGQVQARARLASSGEAVSAIRATLEVLSLRLAGGEAKDLAAQLPEEIGRFLRDGGKNESFDSDQFFRRVSIRTGVNLPVAIYHVRAVMSVLQEAVSAGEIEDVRSQLTDDYDRIFTSGSKGTMA